MYGSNGSGWRKREKHHGENLNENNIESVSKEKVAGRRSVWQRMLA